MKGAREHHMPLMDETVEQEQPVPDLEWSDAAVPSLYLSVRNDEHQAVGPHAISARDELHRQRLLSLGEKVGRLAHDIRNPLSSIEWFATLLGRDHYTEHERREMAEHCIQAVRTLDQLVSNIVAFSGPLQGQQECVDLLALIEEVELLATYHIHKKQLRVQRHQSAQNMIMHGQESLLRQAILNLVMNAIHASEQGGVIALECRRESRWVTKHRQQQSQEGILLRIQDFGCGMTEEERARMFHPFYSRRKGGTGLGLSIVKQVVHSHQGVIDITSQQGEGTTVDLFFPL